MHTITKAQFSKDMDKWIELSLGTEQVEVKDGEEVILILGRGNITEPDDKEKAESEQLDKELAEMMDLKREDLGTSWFD